MENNKSKFSSFTLNAIKSPKLMLLISTFIAIAIDIIATIILFYFNYDLQYVLVPAVMVVLDVVFLVLSINSNYRYKYTILQFISYILLVAVGIGGVAMIGGAFSKHIIMTTLSLIVWASSHVMVCISTLVTSLHAARISKKASGGASLVSVGLLSVFALVTISSLFSNGFFGQGFIEENKTLVYEYIEEEDCYSVKSSLRGRGNTIEVPNTFNGKEVLYFDATLLDDPFLKVVRFEKRDSEITILNFDKLENSCLEEISFYFDKEDIKQMRDEILSLNNDNDILTHNITSFINNSYPTGLESDEVFISFKYSVDDFKRLDGKVYDIWVGKKGDTFNVDYDSSLEYTQYCSFENVDHLHWNYNNNDKFIMNELVDSEGKKLNGMAIQNDIKDVVVSFEKIYKVEFSEDNDEKYSYFDYQQVTTELNDGSVLNYRYILYSKADDLFDEAPMRKGFELKWKQENGNEITSVKELFDNVGNEDTICIYPEWTLKAPIISNINTNNGNNTFTYGDDITFNVDVDSEADGMLYTYKWSDGTTISNGTYIKENVLPSMSGNYTVEVEAYSDTITSLTVTTSANINITINRKTIDFIWGDASNFVYDGNVKTVSCDYDDTDVINGDVITFDYDYEDAINAGSYAFSVSLTGDSDDKYVISSETRTFMFDIKKRELSLNWQSDTSFVYNGERRGIEVVSFNNALDKDVDELSSALTYSGHQKDVGTHTMNASLNHNNYVVTSGDSQTFTITKADLVIRFNDIEMTYNGASVSQSTYTYEIDSVDNLKGSDKLSDVLSFTYSGDAVDNKDVGIYDLNVSYVGKSLAKNYNITIYGSKISIISREISVIWNSNTSLTYNGDIQGIEASSIDNEATGEENVILSHLEYMGYETNAGTYQMSVSIKSGTSTYKNYVLVGSTTKDYKINKANLKITIDNKEKTYDGQIFEDFTYKVEGLKGNDSLDDVLEITFTGNAINQKNYGVYSITATYEGMDKIDNYSVSISNGQLTINKRSVTLIWQDQNTYTYDRNYHSVVVIDAENLIAGDVIEDLDLIYSGNTSEFEAGNYSVTAKVSNDNYVGQSTKQFSIERRVATIVIDDVNYDENGEANYSLTYEVEGLLALDNEIDVVKVTLYVEGYEDKLPTEAGSYIINAKFMLDNDNYLIKVVKGTLTINAVEINETISSFGFVSEIEFKNIINKIDGGVNHALF